MPFTLLVGSNYLKETCSCTQFVNSRLHTEHLGKHDSIYKLLLMRISVFSLVLSLGYLVIILEKSESLT